MTLGPSVALITGWFNVAFRNTAYTPTTSWLKLHVADPGPAGATSPAVYTTRNPITFGAPSSAAGVVTIANTAQIQIVGITGSEDASHYSLWDTVGPAGGNFLGSGIINANAYTAGDTLTFAIGAITIAFNVAN
jgi:hypothetical protein